MLAMPILSIGISCRPFLKFLVPHAERCLYSATRHGSSSVLAKIKSKPRSVQPLPPEPKMKVKPFVKEMFLGRVDGRLLAYPELDLARYETLNDMAAEVQAFLDNVNIDTEGKIPEEVWLGLKQLGLFGMSIPKEYGGLGFSNIEITRLFEVVGFDSSLFYTLNSHHTQVVPTLLCGNEQQKQEYLPQLALGNLVCGMALWEKDAGVDLSRINCRAVQVGDEYILDGSKCWVGNANIADKFLVLVKTKILDKNGEMVDSHTCLLVDKNSVGISTKPMDTVGVKGFDLYEVTFNQTVVPAKNVIGVAGENTILSQLVNSSHTFLVSVAATVLKNIFNITTKHVINREVFHQPLKDYELVKQTLAQVAQRIYTIESMAYFTAGILDFCEDPDTLIEAAIMKVYSAESLVWGVQKCFSVLGSNCYLRDFPYDQILRDAQFALIAEGTSDTLRLFIFMLGLKYVAEGYSDEVIKTRNPHFYPKEAFKNAIKRIFKSVDAEKPINVDNEIIQDLHPSMKQSAAYLDWCVESLAQLTKNFCLKYGSDTQYKQMDMVRLADIAIECYAQAAVASRASRSYCLGFRLCDQEVLVSQSVSYDAYQRVRKLASDLNDSPYLNNDANYLDIANHLISSKGYTMPHPLTRAY